jgi:hypothetical protein
VVLNLFLKFFRYKFSTFDHLDKEIVRVILARERRQVNFKTSRNVGKDEDLQRVRDKFSYFNFLIFYRLHLIWHEIDKHNDETDTLFVNKTTSYAIHMVKCKISHTILARCDLQSQIRGLRRSLKCELSSVIIFKSLTPEVSFYKQT